jgi:hypothetical protein
LIVRSTDIFGPKTWIHQSCKPKETEEEQSREYYDKLYAAWVAALKNLPLTELIHTRRAMLGNLLDDGSLLESAREKLDVTLPSLAKTPLYLLALADISWCLRDALELAQAREERKTSSTDTGPRAHVVVGHWRLIDDGPNPFWAWVDEHTRGDERLGWSEHYSAFCGGGERRGFVVPSDPGKPFERRSAQRATDAL